MEIGSEFFSSTKIAEPPVLLPRPKLLLELEPAYRVFFGNLLDTLLLRSAPSARVTSRPGQFWPDVFVDSEMPWWGFLESMLWHMLAMAGIWSISQGIALRNQPFQRPSPRRTYISYYRPSPTFPVAGARPPRPQPSPATRKGASHPSALKVAREGRRGTDPSAPSLKLGRKGAPDLAGSGGSLPEMPFSATRRSRLSVPAGPNALVAPPPEVYQISGRRGGLPQAAVVAPPPDASSLASRPGLGSPGVAVVEPPPSVEGVLRKFGDVNIGRSDVVAPSPRLPMHEQRAGVGVDQAGMGGSANSVVPPPPSVERSGTLHGGRSGSMAASGTQVVPPPPSIQEAGNTGAGRPGALSGGIQVVPPPPSVEGVGDSAGRGRGAALTGNNFGVVAPAPSAREVGSAGGRGRGTSVAGSGLQVVPPAPSMEGIGNGGASGGRGTAIGGGGLDVVPPTPSARGLGTSGSGTGRAGSLGSPGLQASGPATIGSEPGGAGSGGNGGSGKGSSSGAGTDIASAGGSGKGAAGRGPGGGSASGYGIGNGNAVGKGGSGSGSSKSAEGRGAGGDAKGSAVTGEGNGAGSGSAAGNASGSGASASASAAGSPHGSSTGSSPDGVNIGGGGRPMAADIPRARPPILDNPPGPQDLAVRVIGLAMALPSSSYFSNYEVFIAERRVSKDESQLIKLVYVSLPYQRRLSEYGLNNNRVFKLRVIRDPSCDESLMQMTWPDADQSKPGSSPSSESPELNTSGRNDKLPCYRTTADDYRKAVSRGR